MEPKKKNSKVIIVTICVTILLIGGFLLACMGKRVEKSEEQVEVIADDPNREVILFVEQPERLLFTENSYIPHGEAFVDEYYYQIPDDFSISDEEYREICGKMRYVTATENNIAVITESGDLYMWGNNEHGQIGNGTMEQCNTPVKVLENVVKVELSETHAAAITKKGDLYLWGNNMNGQIGNGESRCFQKKPVKVLSDVKEVSLSESFSGALCDNGELYGWGNGKGNGLGTEEFEPKKIADNVVDFAMNNHEGGYVTADGVLYMWGLNGMGMVGAGIMECNIDELLTPVKIMDGIKSVHIGECTAAAIAINGDLYMWGSNFAGIVGAGVSNDYVYAPVKVLSDVKSVGLYSIHTAAITNSGDLYMWGSNNNRQLGIDAESFDGVEMCTFYSPEFVCENVEKVVSGKNHTAALMTNGEIYMWGLNAHDQILADGSWKYRTPIKVAENMADVAIGFECTYLLDEEGNLFYLGK